MSKVHRLCFWAIPEDSPSPDEAKSDAEKRFLFQEKGKKSSYLMEGNGVLEVQPQIDLVVENDAAERNPFFLGGFQLISNAQELNIYLTAPGEEDFYLTTCKGIPFEKESGENWYKAVCVVPGGPRSVQKLRLKLMKLQPDHSTTTRIKFLKMTARIPDKVTPTSTSPAPGAQLGAVSLMGLQQGGTGSTFFPPPSMTQAIQSPQGSAFMPPVNHPNPNNSPPVTQDDLGAAMAALTMVSRTTKEDMGKTLDEKFSKIEEKLETKWRVMEGYISSLATVIVSQKTVLEEKNKLMVQQKEAIHKQSAQMNALIKNQVELYSVIKTMQSDMVDLCQSVQESAKKKEIQSTSNLSQSDIADLRTFIKDSSKSETAKHLQEELFSTVRALHSDFSALRDKISTNGMHQDFSSSIKSIQSEIATLFTLVKENPSTGETGQQQKPEEISTMVAALHSDVSALRDGLSENEQQKELLSTVNLLQSDITDLSLLMKQNPWEKNSQTHQETISTVKLLQADVSELRQISLDNEEQKELMSAVKSLQADLTDLRQRENINSYEEMRQQQEISSTLNSLQWDVKELQRSTQAGPKKEMQRSTQEFKSTDDPIGAYQGRGLTLNSPLIDPFAGPPIVLGSDGLITTTSIRSLGGDGFSLSMDEEKSEVKKEDPEISSIDKTVSLSQKSESPKRGLEKAKSVESTGSVTVNTGALTGGITKKPVSPPFQALPSLPNNESTQTNDFREITNGRDIKSADSTGSCPGLENFEVSLADDDIESMLPAGKEAMPPNMKIEKRVSFDKARLEYAHPSTTVDLFKPSSGDSDDTEGSGGAKSDNSMFERGMELFKYYSDL